MHPTEWGCDAFDGDGLPPGDRGDAKRAFRDLVWEVIEEASGGRICDIERVAKRCDRCCERIGVQACDDRVVLGVCGLDRGESLVFEDRMCVPGLVVGEEASVNRCPMRRST